MGKKRIESYIPRALEVAESVIQAGINKKKIGTQYSIPNEYNGYVSSFGPSIVHRGLIPTVTFYERRTASSNEKRDLITKAILKIIDPEWYKQNVCDDKTGLLEYLLKKDENERKYYKEKIKDATIALKLSLKTFKLDEGE